MEPVKFSGIWGNVFSSCKDGSRSSILIYGKGVKDVLKINNYKKFCGKAQHCSGKLQQLMSKQNGGTIVVTELGFCNVHVTLCTMSNCPWSHLTNWSTSYFSLHETTRMFLFGAILLWAHARDSVERDAATITVPVKCSMWLHGSTRTRKSMHLVNA